MSKKPYNHSTDSLKACNDFATANKAAALIRKVLLPYTKEFWDKTFYQRLTKAAITVMNTCSPSRKGRAQFIEGNLDFLKRVAFNSFNDTHYTNFQIDIRLQKADFVTIRIRAFDPKKGIKWKPNATSVVLRFVCGIIHFDLEKGGSTALKDLEFPVDNLFPGAQIKIPLESAENSVVLVALCVYFKKGFDKLNRPANKCHAGNIIEIYNIVDGEIKKYQRPDDLKIKPLPPERPEGLDWEINGEG